MEQTFLTNLGFDKRVTWTMILLFILKSKTVKLLVLIVATLSLMTASSAIETKEKQINIPSVKVETITETIPASKIEPPVKVIEELQVIEQVTISEKDYKLLLNSALAFNESVKQLASANESLTSAVKELTKTKMMMDELIEKNKLLAELNTNLLKKTLDLEAENRLLVAQRVSEHEKLMRAAFF